ncbi:SDR family NAD(P)-dependent oxidoreductase [Phenylobacterium sp.]|uniref:SDR family NAD(P)-dependent oxidoreductase n=1 Tax=Phenylobacterium sp. TaxID=1871053 RepID=UPI00356AE6F5
MRDVDGKVAVITGGASGIGLAMAERFGQEGMKLVIADIQEDAIAGAVAALADRGFEALGVRTDVTSYSDVELLAQRTLEAFGKVHVLVNNAGVSITGPTWKMSLDDWRWVLDVNLWGVVHGVKAFTQILIDQGEPAHIVNTASLAAFVGIGEHAPYCASKAACLSISQSLRSELIAANTQVGVSVVCPGMVATDIHRSWRNRPAGHQPWSDREWSDEEFRKNSDAFQGAGVSAQAIAEATLDAIVNDRFYVFYGEGVPAYLATLLMPILKAEEPPLITWGPDLRQESSTTPTTGAAGLPGGI